MTFVHGANCILTSPNQKYKVLSDVICAALCSRNRECSLFSLTALSTGVFDCRTSLGTTPWKPDNNSLLYNGKRSCIFSRFELFFVPWRKYCVFENDQAVLQPSSGYTFHQDGRLYMYYISKQAQLHRNTTTPVSQFQCQTQPFHFWEVYWLPQTLHGQQEPTSCHLDRALALG